MPVMRKRKKLQRMATQITGIKELDDAPGEDLYADMSQSLESRLDELEEKLEALIDDCSDVEVDDCQDLIGTLEVQIDDLRDLIGERD